MKIVVIGDIHGRTNWVQICMQNKDADKIVLVADYFDSKDGYTAEHQIENFQKICELKRKNPEQFILLFGNHDFHYLPVNEKYSGYQQWHSMDIREQLEKNMDILQMCYVYKDLLFSHAGVTKTWLAKNNLDQMEEVLEESINLLFKHQPFAFKFSPGINYSPTGDDITQTPIWVRPESLRKDKIDGYTQIVGHTMQNKIKLDDNPILIDTLGQDLYLVINDEPEGRTMESRKI